MFYTIFFQIIFEADGKIYHHILDPRTGYPCENTLYSDTIITDSSLTADALSTVCYLMGYEAANDLIDQLENVDTFFDKCRSIRGNSYRHALGMIDIVNVTAFYIHRKHGIVFLTKTF